MGEEANIWGKKEQFKWETDDLEKKDINSEITQNRQQSPYQTPAGEKVVEDIWRKDNNPHLTLY